MIFLSEMTGKKKSAVYRKKRKGKPFKGVQRHAKKAKKTPPVNSETPGVSPEQPSSGDEHDQSFSASRSKIKPEDCSSDSSEFSSEETMYQVEGYRLIDLKNLSSTLSEAQDGCACEKGEK